MAQLRTAHLTARILFGLATLASMPAAAATFDGAWSVNIVTRRGACESGASLPIQVNNGKIQSAVSSVQVSGQVGSGGGIVVSVANGLKRANGSGRLSESSGSGTWRAPLCSGTWTAQKS